MIRRSIFDTPTVPRLFTFLEWVRDGQLFIPDFQRPFEWDDERRLNLLDSVSRGLPIGAFLVWRTRTDILKTYDTLGPFGLPKPKRDEVQTFLIDGHQRLTTLYAALRPLGPGELEDLQKEDIRWPVYFDLTTGPDERGFTLAPRRRGFKVPNTWLPTHTLFSPKDLWRKQRELLEAGREDLAERVEQLANAFKDYIVAVTPLVTDDLQAVTDSFVRVNSGGKPMAEDKLLRALVYAEYRIDEHISQLRSDLDELGWGGLKEQVFVNALKVRLGIDVYKAGPFEVQRALRASGQGGNAYRSAMEELGRGFRLAVRLMDACGFPGPAVLPYQYQLIGLAHVLLERKVDGVESSFADDALMRRLKIWLWSTTYTGYFTGMTSTRIRNAIEYLAGVVDGSLAPIPPEVDREIDVLDTFRFSSTRSLALVLLMVDRIPDEALRLKVRARVGELGADAVDRLFPELSDTLPGNRVVTVPEDLQAVRLSLTGEPRQLNPKVAGNHFIPFAALGKPGDLLSFCHIRAQYLADMESAFLKSLGLYMLL